MAITTALIFDLISIILSFIASGYLFTTALRLEDKLKKAVSLLGLGILITITTHSLLSFLSTRGYLEMIEVMNWMSIQILIGSIIIIYATYVLHKGISKNLPKD